MAATGQGAGQAGGDAGQQAQQQGQGEGQATPDFGALVGQIEGIQASHQETRQLLDQIAQGMQAAPWAQQQEQEQQDEPIDLSFLDAGDPAYDPQVAAQHLAQQFDQRLERALQERIGPLHEAQEEQRRQWEASQLASEFSELADPETAGEVLNVAKQYADMLGKPELATEPKFWRLIYMSGRASEIAQQEEGSGDPGAAHLEGGGGANPSGGSQVDPGDLIVQAAQGGRNVLPFS